MDHILDKKSIVEINENIIIITEEDDVEESEEMEEEFIVYNSVNEQVHVLNETGIIIWKYVSTSRKSVEDILNMIKKEYDIRKIKDWKNMILEFLLQLQSKEIINICDSI